MPSSPMSHLAARVGLAAGVLGTVLAGGALARQQGAPARGAAPRAAAPAQKAAATPATPPLVETVIPTKPTDAIAVVNGQPITRGQLADECVSQHGLEVLETMIARKLIQLEVANKKLNITAAEIDQEIAKNAQSSGLSREQFLRMLAKERNISPRQYADYIAYPSLALQKLAEPRVQVTENDIKEAIQANYGEKLRARVVMVDTFQKANDIWKEIRSNPAGFPKIAQERSIDAATASVGGLLPQPIVRFASPRTVSDAAFTQLVDGDPADKDPTHKPKDGDFTGPIQVSEGAFIIIQRVGLEAATPVDEKDPKLLAELKQLIHEAKVEAEMTKVMEDLMSAAAIENKLAGHVKLAGQEEDSQKVDGQVERMSTPGGPAPATAAAPGGTAPR